MTFKPGCRANSYDLHAMAELVECATGAIVEEAVEELEHEIFEW
jgi:hypothetical protein